MAWTCAKSQCSQSPYPFSNHVPFMILIGLVTASYQDDPMKCTAWSQSGPTFLLRGRVHLGLWRHWQRKDPHRDKFGASGSRWTGASGRVYQCKAQRTTRSPRTLKRNHWNSSMSQFKNPILSYFIIFSPSFRYYHYLQDISVDLLRGGSQPSSSLSPCLPSLAPSQATALATGGMKLEITATCTWKVLPWKVPQNLDIFLAGESSRTCVSRVSFHCLPIHVAWNNLLHVWTLFHTHTQSTFNCSFRSFVRNGIEQFQKEGFWKKPVAFLIIGNLVARSRKDEQFRLLKDENYIGYGLLMGCDPSCTNA